jgi:hypothetical protein
MCDHVWVVNADIIWIYFSTWQEINDDDDEGSKEDDDRKCLGKPQKVRQLSIIDGDFDRFRDALIMTSSSYGFL